MKKVAGQQKLSVIILLCLVCILSVGIFVHEQSKIISIRTGEHLAIVKFR